MKRKRKNKSIVLIHGWGGFLFESRMLVDKLRKKGIKVYVFIYKRNIGQESFEELSKKFDKFVSTIKEEFIILGVSQGGIIGSYWLEFLNRGKKCKECLTICTPFHGTLIAYLGFFMPGTKQLFYNSNFLKKLKKKISKSKVTYYNIWNPLDLIVFPGSSAKLGETKNYKVSAMWHSFTYLKKPTIKLIEERINY